MNVRITPLATAAILSLLAACAAQAKGGGEVQRFVDQTATAAEERLADAHVDLGGHPVTVRAAIDDRRELRSVSVVRSSGDRDKDDAIVRDLQHMNVDAPDLLIGATITFELR
jgi:hypothetical protein